MELNNILGSITSNTDKLGLIVGFIAGSPGGLADVENIIANLGNAHMPDFFGAIRDFLGDKPVKQAAMAYIAGMIIDELNPPYIGKYGNAIKKFGVGYGAGALMNKIVWNATH